MADQKQNSEQIADEGERRPVWTAPLLTIFPAESAQALPTAGPEAASTS